MKFASIIFHRSFRSHCPTVGPNCHDNLTVAIENYLQSSDQTLTCPTTINHLRLLFPPMVSHWPNFSSDPLILRSVELWDTGFNQSIFGHLLEPIKACPVRKCAHSFINLYICLADKTALLMMLRGGNLASSRKLKIKLFEFY